MANRPGLGQRLDALTQDVHERLAPSVARLQELPEMVAEVVHLAEVWEAEREGFLLALDRLKHEVAVLEHKVHDLERKRR